MSATAQLETNPFEPSPPFGSAPWPPEEPEPEVERPDESESNPFADDDIEFAPELPLAGSNMADGPVFTDLRDITARDVVWHDRPFLPSGELVTVNADGDTGKGLLAIHYAARFTRGEFGEWRMVVFAVAEDALDTVVIPRLRAAGADLAWVRSVDWRRKGFKDAIRIPDDIPRLEREIQALKAGLLVIDPLLSHLASKTNSYVDHEVKLALQPLVDLAHNISCTVLGNGHFGKDKSRGARSAAQASGAFVNTPRVALAMAQDDEDPDVRVVEVIKSNIGPKNIGRCYRIHARAVAGVTEPQPLLVPEGASSKSIDDLLVVTRRVKRVPAELLKAVVLRELSSGEKQRKHLDDVCKTETGANADSVYKSALDPLRKAGTICPRKDGWDAWHWSLKAGEDE